GDRQPHVAWRDASLYPGAIHVAGNAKGRFLNHSIQTLRSKHRGSTGSLATKRGLQIPPNGITNSDVKILRLLLLTAMLFSSASLVAETVKDREGAVRDDKAAMEKDTRWIYNDYERGFAEAKRTGKPLLVVLRCVPCLACMGIDAQVLLQDTDLTP